MNRQIADYAPIDADAGEVRNRFSQILRARAEWNGSAAFGFAIPRELIDELKQPIAARLDAALALWREHLAKIDAGADYYQRSLAAAGLATGLAAPQTRPLVTDPAIANAVAMLKTRLARTATATLAWRERGWLADDQHHAFTITDAATSSGDGARGGRAPTPARGALRRAGRCLWVGASDVGGQRDFDPDDEHFVFAPLASVLEHDVDVYILDQHPDHFSWVTLDPATGIVAKANKLDREPRRIAGSLVEYLELLAAGYGRVDSSAALPG